MKDNLFNDELLINELVESYASLIRGICRRFYLVGGTSDDLYQEGMIGLLEAAKKLENVKIEDEVTDVECDECGRRMVIKYGPHGKFLACPGFPECRNTKQYLEKIGMPCPDCGKEIVIRKTKKGRKYYGCENNPECGYMSWQKPAK